MPLGLWVEVDGGLTLVNDTPVCIRVHSKTNLSHESCGGNLTAKLKNVIGLYRSRSFFFENRVIGHFAGGRVLGDESLKAIGRILFL